VSLYTTSTPVAVRTRSTVKPVHDAAGYSAEHMLTVKVWPAEAVTPQVASRSVSAAVIASDQDPHSVMPVGANVGNTVGPADVGTCVGVAVGLKITAVTSEPAMTDWPVHAVLAMQPCRMM